MITTLVTVIIVSAFFILFFEGMSSKNKMKRKKEIKRKKIEASTTAGFIEDTYRDPFINHFIPPKVGNIGKFVSYSGIPENHWLHGFPHKKSK
jgi:hypothetical protein